ncbi:MAG: aminotransferase class I/II-fold pyridoxal phosphate-dependent enzyme [Bacteroidales bacterium]|nr:aminotransferase class I/II-fold pyridoxal phosphate-dependent enzyme [Bacteroidales bacterium]
MKGLLTDGDIRRYLLGGGKLEENSGKIMNKNFVFGYKSDTSKELLKKISKEVSIIPIVDEFGKFIDYFEFKREFHVPVAIPDLKGNELNYLLDAFISTWISSSGEYIERFENTFSNYCGCKYGVAVSNGTVAIQLALRTLGIGSGDEVIIPDLTFAATINAVLNENCTPVIVDVDKYSWNISADEIAKAITKKTKAVIPVHLYGQPCNMNEIIEVSQRIIYS